jgi:hypothetical protein
MGHGTEPEAEQRRSIVLDFDGTVTVTDLLDRAALEFGDPACTRRSRPASTEGASRCER